MTKKVQIVLHSVRKGRLVFAVLVLALVITVGCVPAHNLLGGVHLVDAQTSPGPSSTIVTNNITVRSDSISLGSALEANGQVRADGKPLPNASVTLHMGDVKMALTQTDQNGLYAFSVPVGAYYFPAALLNGATVYTVVEPSTSSSISTPSAATSVSVDLVPLYAIIGILAAAVVIALYLFVRRFRKKGTAAAGAAPSRQAEAPVVVSGKPAEDQLPALESSPASEGATPSAGTTTEESALLVTESEHALSAKDAGDAPPLKRARELLEQGNDRQAIAVLYDAALASLASRAGVTLAPHMTHWDYYAVIEAAVPEIREPLGTLTIALELTHYGDKSLTDEQRTTAIAAFESISAFDEA